MTIEHLPFIDYIDGFPSYNLHLWGIFDIFHDVLHIFHWTSIQFIDHFPMGHLPSCRRWLKTQPPGARAPPFHHSSDLQGRLLAANLSACGWRLSGKTWPNLVVLGPSAPSLKWTNMDHPEDCPNTTEPLWSDDAWYFSRRDLVPQLKIDVEKWNGKEHSWPSAIYNYTLYVYMYIYIYPYLCLYKIVQTSTFTYLYITSTCTYIYNQL